jgi:H+-transporting ATPase
MAQPDDQLRRRVTEHVQALADRGYRTLAVASTDDANRWRVLGLLPFYDPPRDDSAQTITEIQDLGVSVKMLTGDHVAIAKELHIES